MPGSTVRHAKEGFAAAEMLGRYFKYEKPGLTGIETISACAHGISIIKMLLQLHFRLKIKRKNAYP